MANKKLNTSGKISKQRKLQKTKRKSRKLSIILIFTILLAVGISAYLLTSPRFIIQEISINGNSKLSSQQISGLAEIKKRR